MKTLILDTTEKSIKRAAEIIRHGGLVAFPTETVYGLGANALDADAVKKIYEAKGRPSDNPTIVHIADASDLEKLTPCITDDMRKLAEAFWPGPLTMVVPRLPLVPNVTTGGLNTVGVRLPFEETARKLIREAGCPIAAPSANISGRPSPTTADHVIQDMDGKIDAIIRGGECKHGIESTVVDMTEGTPCVLRPGVITPEMIAMVLGKEVAVDPALLANVAAGDDACGTDAGFIPKAPGMKYKHYAPKATVTIYELETGGAAGDSQSAIDMGEAASIALLGAMVRDATALAEEEKRVRVISFEDEEDAAKNLFAELRKADDDGADHIFIAAVPEEGIGFAVMNRMLKAAGYNVKRIAAGDARSDAHSAAANDAYSDGAQQGTGDARNTNAQGGTMIIALAADHGGYELKNAIKEHLKELGQAPSPKLNEEGVTDGTLEQIKIVDLGTNTSDSVDYPDYGKACAEAVASGKADLGIVCCGTGIGISIAANKVKGIRCALCTSVEMAELAKQHNNANVLALGGRTTTPELAIEIVDAWLNNKFEGGRHARRVGKLDEM